MYGMHLEICVIVFINPKGAVSLSQAIDFNYVDYRF